MLVSPQPDTSLHCETTDTGLVYRPACLLSKEDEPGGQFGTTLLQARSVHVGDELSAY